MKSGTSTSDRLEDEPATPVGHIISEIKEEQKVSEEVLKSGSSTLNRLEEEPATPISHIISEINEEEQEVSEEEEPPHEPYSVLQRRIVKRNPKYSNENIHVPQCNWAGLDGRQVIILSHIAFNII